MMNVSGLSVGMDVLISIIFGATGALGVWFKLKGKVEIIEVETTNLKADFKEFTDSNKEVHAGLHKRIDSLKSVVEKNRERQDASTNEIKAEMNKMELRIITAIHELRK